jgi:hypothetical protein
MACFTAAKQRYKQQGAAKNGQIGPESHFRSPVTRYPLRELAGYGLAATAYLPREQPSWADAQRGDISAPTPSGAAVSADDGKAAPVGDWHSCGP